MSHRSNRTFNQILGNLGWSIPRSAQALDAGEDDVQAWVDGRRPVPDRILDILRKYEDIYEGKPTSGAHHQGPSRAEQARGPHQTHQDEHSNIKREKLHVLRDAYVELAREYARLAADLPEDQLTSFGPYAVLGIMPGVPWKQVRAQYHALSKAHHPDRGGDEEVMKQISMAYTTLRIIYGE